jgi:FAD/FMN-containing dehydrogenase
MYPPGPHRAHLGEVVGLRLVRADGAARWLGAADPEGAASGGGGGGSWAAAASGGEVLIEQTLLRAARLARGALGVVTELALRVGPAVSVRRVVQVHKPPSGSWTLDPCPGSGSLD